MAGSVNRVVDFGWISPCWPKRHAEKNKRHPVFLESGVLHETYREK